MIGMEAPEIASPHNGDADLVCHGFYLPLLGGDPCLERAENRLHRADYAFLRLGAEVAHASAG